MMVVPSFPPQIRARALYPSGASAHSPGPPGQHLSGFSLPSARSTVLGPLLLETNAQMP